MNAQEHRAATDALYSVGHWLLGQSRERDAADLFRAFAMAAPKDERAWLGLSECHARLGQLSLALQLAGTGTILSSATVRLHLQRARLFRQLDLEDEAQEAIRQAKDGLDGEDELAALVDQEERR